ncbi:MAG: MFS transporter [Kiritimatiellae bacterium]|nr:MFS transporter [Kiritimatiellia bacterium]
MSGAYRWALLALLGCAYYFHQADRALFGLLTEPIQNELGLTASQIGWINTALSWTIAVVTPIAGFVGNRLDRKWVITLSLFFWSLATVGMGFASSFLAVILLRSLATGGGESFYGPSSMAMLARHHEKTRSVAFSIHQAALYLGLMTCGLLAAWALGAFGSWRNVFIFFGACGMALAAVFVFVLKPDRPERKCAEAEGEKPSFKDSLKAYFLNRHALLASSGFVAIVFVNNSYLFWAPKYVVQKYSVGVAEAGKSVFLYHHLLAFAAILLGGVATDRFVRRMPRFRLFFQSAALVCGAPAIAALAFAPSYEAFLVASAAYGLFRGAFEVNTHASVFDVVPAAFRSSTVGYMLLMAFFVGGLFSGWAMGSLFDRFGMHGFEIGVLFMAASYLVAAALTLFSALTRKGAI